MASEKKNTPNTDEVPGRLEDVYCQPCSRNNVKNNAAKYCQDCKEYQCDDCVKAHRLFSVTKCHRLQDLCTTGPGQTLPKYDTKDLDLCKQHDRRFEFFCEDDNTPCCSKCAVINHRKCNSVEEIETIVGRIQTDWTSMLQGISDIEMKAKKVEKHVKDQRLTLVDGSSAIQYKIQMTQDKVNELFKNLKKNVDIEIKSFQQEYFKSLDEMEKSCQTQVAKVEATRCDINGISQLGTEVQQLIFARHVSVLIDDLEKSIDVLDKEMNDVKLSFEFEDLLKLPPARQQFWNLSLRFEKRKLNVTTASDTDSVSHETCETSMQTVDRKNEQRKVSLKCFASLDLKQNDDDKKEPFYTGLDFLPDGRLVAVDYNNKKCVLYNQQLEHLRHLQLVYEPWNVAVSSTSDIIITSGGRQKLYTYRIDKSNKISQVKCVDVSVFCGSVSVVDENTVCVGSFKNKNPVLFLSLQGVPRKLNLKFPTKCFNVYQSACTYLQKTAKIVFTDCLADTVYIQDVATGQLVTVKDKVIKRPRQITSGPDNSIFISCSANDSVVQISQTGQVLGSHSVDIVIPYSICSSPDRRLLAISNSHARSRILRIYKITDV